MIFIFDDSKEPEDIFADTPDTGAPPPNLPTPGAPASGSAAPKDPSKGTTPLPVGETGVIVEKSAFSKKLVFGGVLVGIILIGLGVWYFVFYDRGASVQVNQDDFTENVAPTDEAPLPPLPDGTEPPPAGEVVEEDEVSAPPTTEPEPLPEPEPIVDADGDGLTAAEELSLGTDDRNPDTDFDGLSDREEVRTYGTDPLNADTDGDGFIDGEEVDNGFDPNGDGRLLQIPQ